MLTKLILWYYNECVNNTAVLVGGCYEKRFDYLSRFSANC